MDEFNPYDNLSPPSYDHADSSRQPSIHAPIPQSRTPSDSTSILVPQNDLVMTWASGSEIQGREEDVHIITQPGRSEEPLPSIPVIIPPRSPSPVERPPEYVQAHKPTETMRYTFSPIGHNSMILVPPSDAQNTRPPYYIMVSMNCFMPSSYITTIYRGANEYGIVAAEFEMGIIETTSRLIIGGKTKAIAELLSKEGSRGWGVWTWLFPRATGPLATRQRIRWDYTKRPCVCTGLIRGRYRELAKYNPHLGPGIRTTQAQAQLDVTPEGQDLFDDILTSLLIIERKRLSPGHHPTVKALFN